MKILIAPIHYIISETDGSEYTRAWENLKYISQDKKYSGDVLVGYSDLKGMGNFRIHRLFKKKPSFISICTRFKFIAWVFIKSIMLMSKNKYDCIWHQGPFAIGETFSLLAIFNRKKTRFIIGPIFTPFRSKGNGNLGNFEKGPDGKLLKISTWEKIDLTIYKYFATATNALSLLTLKSANNIITVEKTGEKILRRKNIKNVKTINITLAAKDFFVQPRQRIKNKKIILLSVNYLVGRKRVEDLIMAVRILIDKYKFNDLKLIIVGDGPKMQSLKELARINKLNKHVAFTGLVPRTKVNKYYKKADIFLSASLRESMPGMYFEAMSASLPMVIATNNTALDLKDNGFGGYIVKQNRPDLIAKAVAKIIKNKSLYARLSRRNYNLMLTTYNFEKSMEKLKDIFNS